MSYRIHYNSEPSLNLQEWLGTTPPISLSISIASLIWWVLMLMLRSSNSRNRSTSSPSTKDAKPEKPVAKVTASTPVAYKVKDTGVVLPKIQKTNATIEAKKEVASEKTKDENLLGMSRCYWCLFAACTSTGTHILTFTAYAVAWILTRCWASWLISFWHRFE